MGVLQASKKCNSMLSSKPSPLFIFCSSFRGFEIEALNSTLLARLQMLASGISGELRAEHSIYCDTGNVRDL